MLNKENLKEEIAESESYLENPEGLESNLDYQQGWNDCLNYLLTTYFKD